MTALAHESIGSCLHCDYDLRGLASRVCPECGEAFDLANRETIRPAGAPRLTRAARWWLAPPSKALCIPALLWFLWVLWMGRIPNGIYESRNIMLDGPMFKVLSVLWIGRLFGQCAMMLKHRVLRAKGRGNLTRWALVPLAGVLVYVLVQPGYFARFAMWISEPAMTRMANRVQNDPMKHYTGSRWAGVYRIDEVNVRLDDVELKSDDPSLQFWSSPKNGKREWTCHNDTYFPMHSEPYSSSYWNSGKWQYANWTPIGYPF